MIEDQHIYYIFTLILLYKYQLHRFCLMSDDIEYELVKFEAGS